MRRGSPDYSRGVKVSFIDRNRTILFSGGSGRAQSVLTLHSEVRIKLISCLSSRSKFASRIRVMLNV